jgi:hypothetical protein
MSLAPANFYSGLGAHVLIRRAAGFHLSGLGAGDAWAEQLTQQQMVWGGECSWLVGGGRGGGFNMGRRGTGSRGRGRMGAQGVRLALKTLGREGAVGGNEGDTQMTGDQVASWLVVQGWFDWTEVVAKGERASPHICCCCCRLCWAVLGTVVGRASCPGAHDCRCEGCAPPGSAAKEASEAS